MKKSISIFVILLLINFLSANSQTVNVSGSFEGSNVVDISEVSTNNFTCKLRTPPMAAPESNYYNTAGDHYHNWFMLKIENAAGQTVTVTITNADWGGGGNGMWGRADGKAVFSEATDPNALSSDTTWQKITNATYSNPNFTFTITPASNLVWVALSYPGLPSHTSNWVSNISGNPYVDAEIVTYTSQALPLWMLFITDTAYPAASKKTALFYGQEHSNEQDGALACQGLVDYLLSGDTIAQNLLQNMIFIVIPDVNPDASFAGITNDPDNGLSEEWRNNPAYIERMMPGMSVPMTEESKAIWNRIEQFSAAGNMIDFAFNLHQGGMDNWYGVFELADPVANNFDGFLQDEMPVTGAAWVPNISQGYSRGGWQNAIPSTWPSIRILGRCWEEYRTTAMGYEISVGARATNFLNNMEGIKYFGKAMAVALYNHFGSFNKTLTITSPNGGETFSSGGTANLTWTSTGTPGNVRIDCSTDGGASWANLVTSTPDDGNETISLSTANSNNCQLRISSVTAMGVNDQSDGIFTIGAPPSSTIAVTYPNGGEIIDAHFWKNITWTTSGTASKVNIEISADSGTSWKMMAYAVPNNNSYIINIPGSTSTQCLIKVTSVENINASDVSNGYFTIQTQPAYPTLEVLYPNGGETVTPGSTLTVTWLSTAFSSNVGIRISTDEGANWTSLISSTANDGSEDVTLPLVFSSKCLIWVYEATIDTYVNQPRAFPLDVSDNLFALDTAIIYTQLSDVNEIPFGIEVFPNPCNDYFYFHIIYKTPIKHTLSIANAEGRTLLSTTNENLIERLNTSDFKSGIYLLTVTIDGIQYNQKVSVIRE